MNKLVVDSAIKIFPNPSQEELNILIPQNNSEFSFEIIDLNNRIYLTSRTISTSNTIDVSHLKNGLYFLKITSNGKTEIAKFIKN